MKKKYDYFIAALLSVAVISYSSCKKKQAAEDFSDVKGNYFSIYQYVLDAWNTYGGAPFVILKTVHVDNGRIDSSYTNSDTINWAPIFYTFFASDISDRKYLGQYNFTQFDDNQDETHNFFYMSKDPDLFTQKLLITIDQRTTKVTGIYIETFKKSLFDEETQKLYYAPMKTIQIQTYSKPLWGKEKHTVQQWDFMI